MVSGNTENDGREVREWWRSRWKRIWARKQDQHLRWLRKGWVCEFSSYFSKLRQGFRGGELRGGGEEVKEFRRVGITAEWYQMRPREAWSEKRGMALPQGLEAWWGMVGLTRQQLLLLALLEAVLQLLDLSPQDLTFYLALVLPCLLDGYFQFCHHTLQLLQLHLLLPEAVLDLGQFLLQLMHHFIFLLEQLRRVK
jgi:hypothetical protein